MKRQRELATWVGAILGSLCALLFAVAQSHAAENRGQFTQEFHQTYALAAGGRVALANINGSVHISLDEAKIVVDASTDSVSIRTEYPDHNLTFSDDDRNNPASVEYTLSVPRNARLDGIKLINGALDVQGIAGEVRASCINGHLKASGLGGPVKLSTINNRVEAQFDRLGASSVELASVNGTVLLTMPSDSKAELEASTVHGGISNDFGLRVRNHRIVGHDLHGELAGGGARIKLSNVNGTIEIHHASDNRTLSPVKDLNRGSDSDRDEDDDNQI
ncbi:MAG: hypothetical protein AUI85_06585 [Acidobacteriales bacterium 13_1_40CM_3_55_5]|nr:MAG: hypothetical protein AUI85_06585 [Acidobacteriales bacterium 13_1_40CM_3_55_5]